MKTKTHPLVGLVVSGYLDEQHCLGLVDSVVIQGTGKKKDRTFVQAVVRKYCPSNGERVEGESSWDFCQRAYTGQRITVDRRCVKRVWIGRDEAWVTAADYLDWADVK